MNKTVERKEDISCCGVPCSKPHVDINELVQLVREMLAMLESTEESDSGTIFHPTTIRTCRCMHAAKLDEIMPKIKIICTNTMTEQ